MNNSRFNIGDRIRIKQHDMIARSLWGRQGTIANIIVKGYSGNDSINVYIVHVDHVNKTPIKYLYENDFELIAAIPSLPLPLPG